MTTARFARRAATILGSIAAALALAACAGVSPTPGPGAPPLAPSDVGAIAGRGSVELSWRDNSSDETGFAILRAAVVAGAGPTTSHFEEIATVPADEGDYLDADVSADIGYSYRVAAFGPGGRSQPSAASGPVRPHPSGVPTVDPNDPVGVSLNRLGIDTSPTPRRDEDGAELPESYSPLGAVVVLDRRDELFLAGPSLEDEPGRLLLLERDDDGAERVLHRPDGTDHPWLDDPQRRSAAVAADVDGDGLEEIVVVFMADSELRVRVIDDFLAGFAEEERFVIVREGVQQLTAAAADLDGDATAGLAVGLGLGDRGEILFLGDLAHDFAVTGTRDVPASDPTATDLAVTLALATGNLDHDNAAEIVAVVNEAFRLPPPENRDGGSARYLVLDDAHTGFAALAEAPVRTESGAGHGALVADVALGDLDGDPRDEIAFAGLGEFPTGCDDYLHVFVALDDATAGLSSLGDHVENESLGNACYHVRPTLLRWLPIAIGDLDDDPESEIVAGPFLFDDWAAQDPWTPPTKQNGDPVARFSEESKWLYGDGAGIVLDRDAAALRIVDLDGDGRGEILHFMQENDTIAGWELGPDGVSATSTAWRVDGGVRDHPLIVPVNVDRDSVVARVGLAADGSAVRHELVFTEPIVLAALAAAPCDVSLPSQNHEACSTAFGTGTSSGTTRELSFTIGVGVHVGIEIDGSAASQSELEIKGSFTREATRSLSAGYQIERQVVFSSGPLEDTVVFTTIPFDRYVYTIVQHPDLLMIGREIDVALPREQITMMVERGFYNASRPEGALPVDDVVFAHDIGVPSSYRARHEKDAFVRSLALRGVTALENGPVGVGQGGGAVEASIDVSEEFGQGRSLALEWEFEVEATVATVLFGFSVGFGEESSLTVTSGTSTSYLGSVGSIGAADEFAAGRYAFGMFTYVHRDPDSGRTFEVIDYWVE